MKRLAFPPKRASYVPVDELAASPRARILRAIRHFDWVTVRELFDVLDLPPWKDKSSPRYVYSAALNHLVKRGFIEMAGDRETRVYRLAPNVDVSIPPPALDGFCAALEKRRAS